MEVGLNLYSVRSLIKTEEDFLKTTKKLKEMGYTFMQFSGAPFNAEMIKRVSEECNMPVVLTHVPFDRICNDTENLVKEHLLFGCKNIGIGSMPEKSWGEEEVTLDRIKKLNEAGAKIKALGSKLFYHNHHSEFIRLKNGQTVFEYMIENAPNINFTLDSYWVQVGGLDPATFAKKLKGRIECVHLKDYRITKKPRDDGEFLFEPKFAPVGDGNLDFKKIVKAFKKAGTKYFLVEQDDAIDYEDPLYQVERSVKYLKTI